MSLESKIRDAKAEAEKIMQLDDTGLTYLLGAIMVKKIVKDEKKPA